ncbi:hypothetical protein L915_04254 [Phytophthora nicotianae]|uniref:Uncharacterized protein n=1 Tax=Phytophthora nicotianae TaxID=4792 RepID=W2NTT8_PHYNI|nr:hypothetical protein L915_04254 [Phytophthora nicotianae]ETL45769.1 hypothetical protein L916_04205 [Phytophthora nicotianae]ETM52097.1 hypothetical protein L914_04199 [Phytophthora nicotianae]
MKLINERKQMFSNGFEMKAFGVLNVSKDGESCNGPREFTDEWFANTHAPSPYHSLACVDG